ncbi:anti-sigma-F factor Fin family protein [Lysinibacillus sphaericus]|uniref:YabK n=4 Tax=Lysinibacillus TaxID=400634 RepID=A0A2S0K6F7_LYSSH|nr:MULTISPECIES: anti-sigma-F factor Fin [Lysinibacillus]AHN20109.1 hypothetical protein T479_00360 [Lysinibacillus varians]AVK98916.1 hypothetical protein LS41612_22805 [Lysinibacillus sphaericus]MCS1384588.1 anti-sigma-F factor Fin family protein [Lysinibacillus sphaericus]MED4545218.1 DUF2757 family protein [Lysinibacillus sphaericus]TKI18282.1 anti-sigma-F factor Fin family protein [Lysinibacillus sphaericus]
MAIRYRCRHCEVEIGTLPFDADDTIRKLHIFELGEADDYVEKNQHGETTVHCICEQCEDSLRQYPDYHALNKWIQ